MNEATEAPATIFALSSGALPAGIAIVRISGSEAGAALQMLVGNIPAPRRAVARTLRNAKGERLDHAMVLWLPRPGTVTGEDVAELHLHGGRAVVASVLEALSTMGGLRIAEAGEFTRRAFANGRIDLTEAEGLADLLAAETETQRRHALRLAEGGLARLIDGWCSRLLGLAARAEAAIEFGDDEEDVPAVGSGELVELDQLVQSMDAALRSPPAERLRDGFRIVVAGPVNAGKSSLINRLAGREVAITSSLAGTTRDLIEVPLAIGGLPCLLIDSAGLRDAGGQIEQIGIARARAAVEAADLVLWLGSPEDSPLREKTIVVAAKADLAGCRKEEADVATSTVTGVGIAELLRLIRSRLDALIPPADGLSLNARQRAHVAAAREELAGAASLTDPLLVAEHLRLAREALDRVTGRMNVEDMLDGLFGRFCIGK